MNTQEENELVKALQSEEKRNEAFKKLITIYKERLYWHIRHLTKNHSDTDDVLQNVFIKVYKNIGKFKGDSKLYSWLYRIATNESLSFLQKKARQQNISSEELQQQLINNLTADVYYEGDAIQIKLEQAIATLPDKQQQVFMLKYYQELKYREISELLNTSEGALKASYHLAVKKIEQFLKNN